VLVDEWARAGVTDAVVAPGSRSTPMLIALAQESEAGRLRLHVVLDERDAGFLALGLGLASGRPAAVVTTSGTASVELHPAIVEADRSGVPLLAVTADRPPELHDCGAPQTVHQLGLFGPSTRWDVSPGVPGTQGASSWRSIASRAVNEALGARGRPGPVHLNLAFREPLVGDAAFADELGGPGRGGGSPWHQTTVPLASSPAACKEAVSVLARAGEKGLIVAGGRGAGADVVQALGAATGWPVLADPLSGCRRPGAIAAADALLRNAAVRDWRPDAVLRLGVPWASRVVNEWLGELDCPQVLAQRWPEFAAADRRQAYEVFGDPDEFCRAVAAAARREPGEWKKRWSSAEMLAQSVIDAALADDGLVGKEWGLTEPALSRSLMRALPEGSALFVSSSMPVRDLEWWSESRSGVEVLANRGANGIDGVLATAIGVAANRSAGTSRRCTAKTVALLGDLAFLYDAGALLWSATRDVCLDVVVADNDGGAIFDFLPQAQSQPDGRFEQLWGTPHGLDLCEVARAYGAQARQLRSFEDVRDMASEQARGVRFWLARFPRHENVAVHEKLHVAVGEALNLHLR
jgi:2-succinyl-5-enolpyruvyl-6-hydroxy-3-cyclohexene-1-carboxylate synthase